VSFSAASHIKPVMTKENVYVQCSYRAERLTKTAFQFLIEDGKVRYLQPFTGKTSIENKTSLLQAKTQTNVSDETGYNFGFHPQRGKKGPQQLKIFGSKMMASSIWIPGSFLKNPKAASAKKAKVIALLSQDRKGIGVRGQGQTESFNCTTSELQ
jgi:hypothetical protein